MKAAPPPAGVSVVIPAYNYAHYLPTAIRSALEQTLPPAEVLLVDDGSTDETRRVVEGITDPRLRYVCRENGGLSAARNTGIAEAKHPLIAFLDADDRWEPDFLKTVVGRFSEPDSPWHLIATATSRMDAEGTALPPPRHSFERDEEITVRTLCIRNRPYSSSIVVRREVFEKCGGFDPLLRSSEDRDMWIRATSSGFRFWFFRQPLGCIRRHGGNMSKHAPRMKSNTRVVLRKAWNASAVPRHELSFWMRVWSDHYYQIARTHFDGGFRIRGFVYLAISCALWPLHFRPKEFYEAHLFRLRTFASFCRQILAPER